MEVIYVKGWRSCGQKKHPGSYWKEEMDARDPRGGIDRIWCLHAGGKRGKEKNQSWWNLCVGWSEEWLWPKQKRETKRESWFRENKKLFFRYVLLEMTIGLTFKVVQWAAEFGTGIWKIRAGNLEEIAEPIKFSVISSPERQKAKNRELSAAWWILESGHCLKNHRTAEGASNR